jgi:hypothetical protein
VTYHLALLQSAGVLLRRSRLNTPFNPSSSAYMVRVQVTAGSALGVVSLGQDSLMSTTYTGPAYALGGFTSSNGMAMQQQQQQQGGEMLPGSLNGMAMQQQQPGGMGMGMNGGMMNGMGMGNAAMPGQQVMGAEQGQVSAKATSGAAAAAVGASVLAGLAFVLALIA